MHDSAVVDVPHIILASRLRIAIPKVGDGQAVYEAVRESLPALRRFPASMIWATREQSLLTAERFCREAAAAYLLRKDFSFLLWETQSETVVGCAGLHKVDWNVPKFEIGFWGRSSRRKEGLVTEAVAALVELATTELRANRLAAFVDDKNVEACRLCERVGLNLEGTLHNDRVDPDGVLRNIAVYSWISDRTTSGLRRP